MAQTTLPFAAPRSPPSPSPSRGAPDRLAALLAPPAGQASEGVDEAKAAKAARAAAAAAHRAERKRLLAERIRRGKAGTSSSAAADASSGKRARTSDGSRSGEAVARHPGQPAAIKGSAGEAAACSRPPRRLRPRTRLAPADDESDDDGDAGSARSGCAVDLGAGAPGAPESVGGDGRAGVVEADPSGKPKSAAPSAPLAATPQEGVAAEASAEVSAGDQPISRAQLRAIKNRESAARSRARRQAYTQELERQVEELRASNERLKQRIVQELQGV